MMRFLVAVILCLLMNSAIAQETSSPKDWNFALGGGLFISQSQNDDMNGTNVDIDEELTGSFNVGARVLYTLNENFAFRTGLYLQEKKSKYSFKYLTFDGDITLSYVQAALPLTLQYKLNDQIALFGGYSADFAINDYCSTDGDFKSLGMSSCSIDEKTKSVVHNATIGISIKGNDKFDIDFSYQHGLTDVRTDEKIHSVLGQFFFKI